MKPDEFQFDTEGRITSPGKFEGEMIYVPYFWECFVDGSMAEERPDGSIRMDVIEDDKVFFKFMMNQEREPSRIQGLARALEILKKKTSISFDQSDDGFITERRAR